MRIRAANINDIEGIMNVVRNSGYPLSYQNSQETIKFFLESANVIVAEEMDVVGYAVVKKEFRDGAELESIEVNNRLHGKGVAEQLLQRAEQTAKKMKKSRLYIKCWTGNERANAFYLKNGFVKLETLKKHYSGGEDAFIWCKVL